MQDFSCQTLKNGSIVSDVAYLLLQILPYRSWKEREQEDRLPYVIVCLVDSTAAFCDKVATAVRRVLDRPDDTCLCFLGECG